MVVERVIWNLWARGTSLDREHSDRSDEREETLESTREWLEELRRGLVLATRLEACDRQTKIHEDMNSLKILRRR